MRNFKSLRKTVLWSVGTVVLASLLGAIVILLKISDLNGRFVWMELQGIPLQNRVAEVHQDVKALQKELRLGSESSASALFSILEEGLGELDRIVGQNSDIWRSRVDAWKANLERIESERESALVEIDAWIRDLEWAENEAALEVAKVFETLSEQMGRLKWGLQVILVIVALLSFFILWLSERALRPLGRLTEVARAITRRGLHKEDKTLLPEISLGRSDEVSELTVEFKAMATALLEREKTVEYQKTRLEEQNRELQEITALNEVVLKSMDSLIWVVSRDLGVVRSNPRAERLLKEFQGTQNFLEWIQKFKVQPNLVQEYSGRLFLGRWLQIEGDHAASLVVAEDVTERLGMEDRLKQAETLATLGRMSAQVAHDVRNPLHAIGLEAELGLEYLKRGEPQAVSGVLKSVLEGVDRLEVITENYLKLSRVSQRAPEAVPVREWIERALASLEPEIEVRKIQVEWSFEHLDPGINAIAGDRSLFDQALLNLLRNAVQAVDRDQSQVRKIWIEAVSLESGRILIAVEDSGPGFSEQHIDKVFQPFFTTKAEGTGLGLSFVKMVLSPYQATVRATHGTRNRGARVECIFLPYPMKREELTHESYSSR